MAFPAVLALLTNLLVAEDWPEWRGKGRQGIWNETGILTSFPDNGLKFRWRAPSGWGYSGPAVADGRVFLLDYLPDPDSPLEGRERITALDEKSGSRLWSREWKVDYRRLMASYARGPRATPTVDGNRVYVVGATGTLRSLNVETGEVIWGKDYVVDYGTDIPTWGVTSAPLVEGRLLITLVGGKDNAKVVAFDKHNGAEVWRALSSDWEMGYAQPIIFEAGGARQLIIWHPRAVSSLDPATGEIFWEQPWDVRSGLTVATPVRSEEYLFLSQFYGGAMMLRLNQNRPTADLLWKRRGIDEKPDRSDSLHALITTPSIEGDTIFGIGAYGQLRGLDATNGDRLWESLEMTELARWSAAFWVRNGNRYFVNNDQGDLIIARFDRSGYSEIDRTQLIRPTSNSVWGSRPERPSRRDRIVNWSHPAYANRHIFARNDEEIVCASLEEE